MINHACHSRVLQSASMIADSRNEININISVWVCVCVSVFNTQHASMTLLLF